MAEEKPKYWVEVEGVRPPDGAELITIERARQIEEEGWSANHDDLQMRGQLSRAAACYIFARNPEFIEKYWPFLEGWWKPSDDGIRNLIKAGALIAAEIDRLLRLKERKGG